MAAPVFINSTYAGKEQLDLLVHMFQAMIDIEQKNVTLHDDVNYKKSLRRMVVSSDILQDEDAAWTPVGTATVSEVILEPKIREVNLQLDKNNFRSEWSSARMGRGQMNKKIANEISKSVTASILGIVGEALYDLMWNGDETDGDVIDGFMTILMASTGVDEAIKPTFEAITAANVLAKLTTLLFEDMPQKYLDFKKTRIFMAPDVYGNYALATGNQSNTLDNLNATPLMFAGYKIVVEPAFTASNIVIANTDNLHYGTDIYSDASSVTLKDMSAVDLTDYLRFKQKVAIDVKIGWTSECLIYSEAPVVVAARANAKSKVITDPKATGPEIIDPKATK